MIPGSTFGADLLGTMGSLALAETLRPFLPGKSIGPGDLVSPVVYAIVALNRIFLVLLRIAGVTALLDSAGGGDQ